MKNNISILTNLYITYNQIKLFIAGDTKKFISIISAFLLVFLIRSSLAIIDTLFVANEFPIQRVIFILSTSLMIMGLEIGFTKCIFHVLDNKKIFISNIFNYFHLLGPYILGTLIYYCSISVGIIPGFLYLYSKYSGEFINIMYTSIGDPYFQELISAYFNSLDLLILLFIIVIPAIYISLRLSFWSYFVIEKETSGIDAIKRSYTITKNKELEIICYLFFILIFNILGLLSIVGICFTIPLTYMFLCQYYRLLAEHSK